MTSNSSRDLTNNRVTAPNVQKQMTVSATVTVVDADGEIILSASVCRARTTPPIHRHWPTSRPRRLPHARPRCCSLTRSARDHRRAGEMTALVAHEAERFMKRPDLDAGILLVYGPDTGLTEYLS